MTYTSVWGQMISRCFDTEHPSYKNYGGRGIRVCDRWLIHRLFIEDMGPKPKGMSLNRIDNDGNYEPGNCEWASDYVQNRNKRNNRRITFNGETLCVSEWAEKIGMKMTSLTRRLNSGWSVEDALTKPINLKNSRPYKGKRAVNTAIDTNVEVKTPAADTDKVREAWAKDAETWGGALNEAACVFLEVCPEKSTMLFNHVKQALRAAILKYAEKVAVTMAAQAPVREVPVWVSVKDRLPDMHTEVMVWPHPSDECMTAEVRGDGTWYYSEYTAHHGWDSVMLAVGRVTHWMPLPAAPV